MAERGWLNRAKMAAQYARYSDTEDCPKTKEMRAAIMDVIAAWEEVLSTLTGD